MEKPSEPLDPDEKLEPAPHVAGPGAPASTHGTAAAGVTAGVAPAVPPGPKLELTWQAVVVALLVAAVVSASYPYVVLKLGMGPNISVVSAFLGAILLLVLAGEAIQRGAESLTLEVRVGNKAAQELYRKFGFRPCGIRKNYYVETNEDALVMWADDVDSDEYAERLDKIDAHIPGRTIVEEPRTW